VKINFAKIQLADFRSKKWWIKQLKEINMTEALLFIIIILMYFQVSHVKEVAQDPCSFCIINQAHGEPVTCKEYFQPTKTEDFSNEQFNASVFNLET
jgi:hypothetical protein